MTLRTCGDADVVVLTFGGLPVPRALRALPHTPVANREDVDATGPARRLIVVGSDADLASVLTRLLRTERLDVELAYVPRRRSAATRAYGLPAGRRAAGRAHTGEARRVPLIRDDGGHALVGAALWVGETGLEKGDPPARLTGEAVVDDTVLFDGAVTGVRIEPTRMMPGLRAAVVGRRMGPRRWVTGRAAQLGTTGAVVVRDGERPTRALRRSTFYRNTKGWLLVG